MAVLFDGHPGLPDAGAGFLRPTTEPGDEIVA